MMAHTYKRVRLKTERNKRGMYFESATVYPNGETYLLYYSKLQRLTNIDSLNWYSVVMKDKKGKPRRFVRYTPELQQQLIQTFRSKKEERDLRL